jgi:hypothetical protein
MAAVQKYGKVEAPDMSKRVNRIRVLWEICRIVRAVDRWTGG